MSIKYIFRIDDICPDMNYVNFSRIRDLFFRYDIKPIIGVIPHNEDQKLVKQAGENGIEADRFWAEVKELQDVYGWAIALHGYNHVYTTEDSGMFKVNKRAEFAGIPFGKQNEKIEKGKTILLNHGLRIDAFMAPAHSMDWNTVEALKSNGISVVTDGKSNLPYCKKGTLFVPQTDSWPKMHGVGIHTVCLHINEWDETRFSALENAIRHIQTSTTDFMYVVSNRKKYEKKTYRVLGLIFKMKISIDVSLRKSINRMPGVKKLLKGLF